MESRASAPGELRFKRACAHADDGANSVASVARTTSGLFTISAHSHSSHVTHCLSHCVERAQPQEHECADRGSRPIVRFERTRHEIERAGNAKGDRRPVRARNFANVTKLSSTDVQALPRRQPRQGDTSAGSHGIRHDQLFSAFLNQLRSSEQSVAAVYNCFALE